MENQHIVNLPLINRHGGEFTSRSFNETANTIDIVWTTGQRARMNIPLLGGMVEEELVVDPKAVRLDRLNSGAPLLDSHSRANLSSVIGAIVPGSARIAAGKGLATVVLSRAPEHASIVQNIRDGIIRNISAGYAIHAAQRIDNQRDGGDLFPIFRVTDWEPMELSALAVGADSGARFRDDANSFFGCTITYDAPPAPMMHAIRMRMKQRHLGQLVHRQGDHDELRTGAGPASGRRDADA